jgi:hypothetical protein
MQWIIILLMPMLALAEAGQEQNLLRLFSTPQQRTSLERLRFAPSNMPVNRPSTQVSSRNVHIQGYVMRSDGKSGTVWLNNQALLENSQNDGVSVGKLNPASHQVPVQLPNRRLSLKVGQEYDAGQNKVVESSGRVRNITRD